MPGDQGNPSPDPSGTAGPTRLSKVVVERRTGQIGIVHGIERFVSTQVVLKKERRVLLDTLARKIGLPGVTLVDR